MINQIIQTLSTRPQLLPVYGAKLWLDGNDVNGNNTNPADNTAISSWVDKMIANNAIQATGVNQPLFKTNIQNSKPGILFNGTTTQLVGNLISSNPVSTIFVVSKANISINSCLFFGSGSMNANGMGIVITASATKHFGIIFSGVHFKDDGLPNTNAHRFTATWDGTTSVFYVDSVSQAIDSGTIAPNTPTTAYMLGADGPRNANFFLNGYVFEVVYFDFVLSAGQMTAMNTYLSNKWGI